MTMRRASRRVGRRATALLLKLYGRLRLKVNQSEIAVASVFQRKFPGVRLPGGRRR